jgi:DNA-binding transcriptional LysR family regulator
MHTSASLDRQTRWTPTRSAIDLDLLCCFVTVVESGGFTQASKRLHVTQSAITLKIKRLEELLGRRLFLRTSKPLELTAEGEVVMGYAFRLLELSEEMVQRITKPRKTETVRLGVVQHFGYDFLPVWLSEFSKVWPHVHLVTDMGTTADLFKGLEQDRFDLIIASSGYTAMSEYKMASMIQERHLQTEKLIWVQAENSRIDPARDPLPLVMFGPLCRFRPICLDALHNAGRTWEIVFDGGSLTSVQKAVESDLGFSVLSQQSLVPGIRQVNKKLGLPTLPQAELSLYSRRSPSETMVQRLAFLLIEAVGRWENSAHAVRDPTTLHPTFNTERTRSVSSKVISPSRSPEYQRS